MKKYIVLLDWDDDLTDAMIEQFVLDGEFSEFDFISLDSVNAYYDFHKRSYKERNVVSLIILDQAENDHTDSIQTSLESRLFSFKKVREIIPTPPIILLSASITRKKDDNLIKVYDEGFIDFLDKPFKWPVFRARVMNILRLSEYGTIKSIGIDGKEPPLDADFCGSNWINISDDESIIIISRLTKDLSILVDNIKGDNRLFSDILRQQLIVTFKRLLVELEAEIADAEKLQNDAILLSETGKKITDQALSKGLGNIFKRCSDAIFDLISIGYSGS